MAEQRIGVVSKYFGKVMVAAVQLEAGLAVGDPIVIRGASSEVKLNVESMQIEHQAVSRAEPGQAVGIKVPAKVREGDVVYRVTP